MATSVIPTTMKAVVFDESGGQVSVKEHPVPTIADNEILVKTVAISQNPSEWKHIDWKLGKPGSILGLDYSGIVVKAGKDVSSGPKVGDHVAGVAHSGAYPDKGAFAEYVKADPELVWIVPENTFSHEQAAAYGTVFWTAVQALYNPKHLGLVEPPKKVAKPEWILIYGGSTACGLSAIQLAHLSGYKVVTTASSRNHELLKSLGADVAVDYHEHDLVAKIKQATGDAIKYGADMIADDETKKVTVQAIGPSGGKVVGLNPLQSEESGRNDVTCSNTMLNSVYGYAYSIGSTQLPAVPQDKAHMAAFLKKLPQLVRDGAIKPKLPIKLWEGGLEAVQDGLQYMREGRVSAEKIVYRV
ncbi:GroES-like protein [Lentinus tigrinus ALCF2SS1-7]|uniref:GroES-like protein n=1 Tax=Lentinus tigrinus ALCF2SS1-6 TaxID=1328759 RepID=A0A5C2ST95_9APHY|nr:GroES-like protein [Lentinus tigrinus ALCF2SS1-6]RPD80548.1 GroES-like protein [Lentinus tigrinus ALCF2SS1-7]